MLLFVLQSYREHQVLLFWDVREEEKPKEDILSKFDSGINTLRFLGINFGVF